MTAQEINEQLHRPIWSGFGYDRYFPESACEITNLATGNTAVAIKEMAKWAKKYAHHCKDIAPILYGDDLEETVNSIQDFLYNHIQYSIDGENQNLKSPACAWATRVEGTDCKSYSIFASAILLNLDIKHYLRRIKQASVPDAYTHVYVVVPVDQKTGKLNNGYFIIDGTIQLNNELAFTAKDDIFMEPNLTINGLAGALGCAGNANCGCNSTAHNQRPYDLMYNNYPGDFALAAPDNDFDVDVALDQFNGVLDLLEQNGVPAEYTDQVIANLQFYIDKGVEPTLEQLFVFDENQSLGFVGTAVAVGTKALPMIKKIIPGDFLKKIFNSIDCIGGSAFGGSNLKSSLETQTQFIQDKINAINQAVYSANVNLLAKECTEFLAANEVSHKTMVKKLSTGWNSCSTKNFKTFIEFLTTIKDYNNKALEAWLNDSFIVSYGSANNYTNKSFEGVAGTVTNFETVSYSQRMLSLALKPTTTSIPAFEFNETLNAQISQKSGFNASSFLQSLTDIIAVYEPPASQNNNSNSSSNNNSDNLNDGNNTKQAGGNIGMILIAAAAVGGLVYTQTKKPKTK